MSQASLGLNPCFLYLTFELFDVWTWCPDMILTLYQKMVWAHWLILQIWLMRITTLLYWSILLILVAFLTSLDPSIPFFTYTFDTLIEDIKGRNLVFTSPSELMRILSIFIALLRGPSFGRLSLTYRFDFLCCVYFDFIGQVRKCRKQIYFCNIVMVGHFTFGLCQRLQSGQRL